MTIAIEKWIHLNDGRRLGFITCGDEKGLPIFYCHGFPGSRLEVLMADDIATRLSIRLIGVDRPGYGLSDPQPSRSLTSWASDIAELAEILQISRFHILGVSGGGPYAAACAYMLPLRLLSVGILCGLAPISSPGILHGMNAFNRCGLLLSARMPSIVKNTLIPVSLLIRHHPNIAWSFVALRAKQPDRSFLHRRGIRQVMCMTFREAMRSGIDGACSDLRLYAGDWGFRLNDIRVPVNLWHGEKDHIVPVTMGRWMAATIPECHAEFSAMDGHFSLIIDKMQHVLKKMISRSSI
jgi:pimeloyl-ACP methyl ester carboxylesterase